MNNDTKRQMLTVTTACYLQVPKALIMTKGRVSAVCTATLKLERSYFAWVNELLDELYPENLCI